MYRRFFLTLCCLCVFQAALGITLPRIIDDHQSSLGKPAVADRALQGRQQTRSSASRTQDILGAAHRLWSGFTKRFLLAEDLGSPSPGRRLKRAGDDFAPPDLASGPLSSNIYKTDIVTTSSDITAETGWSGLDKAYHEPVTGVPTDPPQLTTVPRLSGDNTAVDLAVEPKPNVLLTGDGQDIRLESHVSKISPSNALSGPPFSIENLPTTTPRNPPVASPSSLLTSEDPDQCVILYPSVVVYYPPATSSNTDCLTDAVGMPSATLPPGLEPKPGSAYVVIPELSAGNTHTQIATYTSLTFEFGPGELSTIQGPANITKEFNFADLPCPPPDIASDVRWFYNPAVNPTRTYAPVVAPFSQLYDLDPAFHGCSVALNQGFDPSVALPTAKSPTLPGPDKERLGHLRLLHRRKLPVTAHHVPRVALPTDPPLRG